MEFGLYLEGNKELLKCFFNMERLFRFVFEKKVCGYSTVNEAERKKSGSRTAAGIQEMVHSSLN